MREARATDSIISACSSGFGVKTVGFGFCPRRPWSRIGRDLPRHGDRAHASRSGAAAPTQGMVAGLTVGAPLLRIGQIRMTDTSLGLVFVQYHPTVAEMSDVLLIRL